MTWSSKDSYNEAECLSLALSVSIRWIIQSSSVMWFSTCVEWSRMTVIIMIFFFFYHRRIKPDHSLLQHGRMAPPSSTQNESPFCILVYMSQLPVTWHCAPLCVLVDCQLYRIISTTTKISIDTILAKPRDLPFVLLTSQYHFTSSYIISPTTI